MSQCACPNCGHEFEPRAADPLAALTEDLRAHCVRTGQWVSADGRVSTATAALLLDNRSERTLVNWRSGSDPLPFHRIGGPRGRITYSLTAIAAFIRGGAQRLHAST